MSNNPVKPLERNIAIGAVILGVATFPFLLGRCQLSDLPLYSQITTSVEQEFTNVETVHVTEKSYETEDSDILDSELEQAYGREEVLQAELTDARNRYYAIEQEMKRLRSEYNSFVSNASTPKEAIKEIVTEAPEIDPQVALLTSQLTNLTSEKATAISSLNDKLKNTSDKILSLQTENSTQQAKIQELQALLKKDDVATREQKINKTISSLREENTTLRRETDRLKNNITQVEQASQVKLEQGLAPLRKENKGLRKQIGKLRAQNSFASSAEDLSIEKGKLFKQLQSLEGKSAEELNEAYTLLENELNADDLTRVKFETGSTLLNTESTTKIQEILQKVQKNDVLLVIGYASNQGDKALNERLSSNRAKAVTANVITSLKDNNVVQSVYLGETTRFGEPKENQCVEIWRIAK